MLRLYHDTAPDDPLMSRLCSLACQTDLLDLCDVKTVPRQVAARQTANLFPMLWRFLPTLDPQVSVFLSRDLDSVFTGREVAAVREWLQSGKSLHSMRDHPAHHHPLMAGMWGTKISQDTVRQQWLRSVQNILADPESRASRESKIPDQSLLKKWVWTWAQSLTLQHDSYT